MKNLVFRRKGVVCFYMLFVFLFYNNVLLAQKYSGSPVVAQHATLLKIDSVYSFTEGPVADRNGNVYFTDQPNNAVYVWSAVTNDISLFTSASSRSNGLFFSQTDDLYACADRDNQIIKFDSLGNKFEIIGKVNNKKLNGPNDLWINRFGGIYFTDPYYKRKYWKDTTKAMDIHGVYYRHPDGEIILVDSTLKQPNGIIGFQNILYVADIREGFTYRYKMRKDGKLKNKKLFCKQGSDGMTIDAMGNVYLTGKKGVMVYNKKGKLIEEILVPAPWTANVTFGGKKFSTLFITAGKSVYIIEMKTKGVTYLN